MLTFETLIHTPLAGGLCAQGNTHGQGQERVKRGGRGDKVSGKSDYRMFDRMDKSLIGEERGGSEEHTFLRLTEAFGDK